MGTVLGCILASLLVAACGYLLATVCPDRDFDGLGAFGIHIVLRIGLVLCMVAGGLSYGFGSRRTQWYIFFAFAGFTLSVLIVLLWGFLS